MPGQPPAAGPDPNVSIAFALGWQMADLYRWPAVQAPVERRPGARLPGAGNLVDGDFARMGIDQLAAGLHRLSDQLAAAGERAPSLSRLRVLFAGADLDKLKDELYRF